MKIKLLTFCLTMLVWGYGLAQNLTPTFQSNPQVSFAQFISGVKYADIGLNFANQSAVDKGEGIAPFYKVAQQYLQEIGFEFVALTSAEKTSLEVSLESYCEATVVLFGGDIDKKSIANSTITFVTCMGDVYSFTSSKKFNYGRFRDVEQKLIADWKSIVKSKGTYKKQNQLALPYNPSQWNLDSLKSQFTTQKATLKPVEGIYERVRMTLEDFSASKYTIGIVQDPGSPDYLIVYFSGASNTLDWRPGEIKGRMMKTATPGFFSVDWITRNKALLEDAYCRMDERGLHFYSSGLMDLSYTFYKIFPTAE